VTSVTGCTNYNLQNLYRLFPCDGANSSLIHASIVAPALGNVTHLDKWQRISCLKSLVNSINISHIGHVFSLYHVRTNLTVLYPLPTLLAVLPNDIAPTLFRSTCYFGLSNFFLFKLVCNAELMFCMLLLTFNVRNTVYFLISKRVASFYISISWWMGMKNLASFLYHVTLSRWSCCNTRISSCSYAQWFQWHAVYKISQTCQWTQAWCQ
jgi:hypothetical protein